MNYWNSVISDIVELPWVSRLWVSVTLVRNKQLQEMKESINQNQNPKTSLVSEEVALMCLLAEDFQNNFFFWGGGGGGGG